VLTATAIYTTRNGDELVSPQVSSTPILSVPGTPYFAFTSQDEVTGGTGRMAGASGSITADITFNPTATPISAHFAVSGTVTLPKK
jgi:hypothetical protein